MGAVSVGSLLVGSIAKSRGIDLCYRNWHGTMPGSALDAALRDWIRHCHLAMSHRPMELRKLHVHGAVLLAATPLLGVYGVEDLPDRGCELFRLLPLIRRPRS